MKTSKLNEPVRPHVGLLLAITIFFGVIALVVVYVRGALWGQEFPRNSFLPAPVTRFGDFFGNYDHWRRLHFDDISYAAAYLPTTYLFLHFVVSYLGEAYDALVLFFLTILVGMVYSIRSIIRTTGTSGITGILVFLLLFVNYPMLFMIHTGNLEGWVFVLLLLVVANILREKPRRAAVFLGIAIAMKLYPLVFLAVLLHGRKRNDGVKLLVTTGVCAISSTLFSLLVLPGGLTSGLGALRNMSRSQELYKELMIDGAPGVNFGHSLLNGIHAVFGLEVMRTKDWWLIIAVIGILALVGVFFLQNCSGALLWRQAIAAACIGCLFVPTSTDYKLLYFVPGIALFCCIKFELSRVDGLLGIFVVAIIAPKPWLIISRSEYYNAGVWLTPILMVIVLGILVSDALFAIKGKNSVKSKL